MLYQQQQQQQETHEQQQVLCSAEKQHEQQQKQQGTHDQQQQQETHELFFDGASSMAIMGVPSAMFCCARATIGHGSTGQWSEQWPRQCVMHEHSLYESCHKHILGQRAACAVNTRWQSFVLVGVPG